MKIYYSKLLFIGFFLCLGIDAKAQNYIPESSTSVKTAEIILKYSHKKETQRPSANLKFKDGFKIDLNAVCEGDYAWCMRVYENDRMIELGSLKIEFHKRKNIAILKTKIINFDSKYKKYLDLVPGKFKKVK